MWSKEIEAKSRLPSSLLCLSILSMGSPHKPQIHPSLSKISISSNFSVTPIRILEQRRLLWARVFSGWAAFQATRNPLTRSGFSACHLAFLALTFSGLASRHFLSDARLRSGLSFFHWAEYPGWASSNLARRSLSYSR